jgi:hypothetical protein
MQGILIFFYVGGAGAKFIANCLTYSGQVAFSNYKIAVNRDPAEYHRELLATIPDRSASRTWLNHEHGCYQLYGNGITLIKTPDYPYPIDNTLNDLTPLSDLWLPVMTHTVDEVCNLQHHFKDRPQRIVAVDATPEFIDLAIRLKWPGNDHCLDLDQYNQYQKELKELKTDYIFGEWDPRDPMAINQILEFAHWLGIELDLTPARDYINRYRAFHL